MAKRGGESMQRAPRDELEKYQVNESVALKEKEILATTNEELLCNFVFHVSYKSLLLSLFTFILPAINLTVYL